MAQLDHSRLPWGDSRELFQSLVERQDGRVGLRLSRRRALDDRRPGLTASPPANHLLREVIEVVIGRELIDIYSMQFVQN